MKNFLKIFGFCILGIIILVYLSFLFILPNAVDVNKFKPDVQKIVKENVNLNINFENAKIITTPLLGVGIKAEDISIKLPDGSLLLSADNLKTRVAIPSALLLTVKVSCFEMDNPFINFEILNDKQYKVVSLIEDILNGEKEQKLDSGENPENPQKGWFNPAWIKIKVPNVVLNNYLILVNDLKSKHTLSLKGEKLNLGYFNRKRCKIKTFAELYSDENRNITADIDINTVMPKPAPKLDEEDDRAERIDIPFINVVNVFRNYDPKFAVNTKLYIRKGKSGITSYGHFNLEDFTIKISNLTIPNSYFRAKSFGTNVDIDSNIFLTKEQNLKLLGKVDYNKHANIDMNIKTTEIKFNDLLNLGKAFLDSLSIKHELGNYTAKGSVNADCYIKTNFKKLRSNGHIDIKDSGLSVRGVGNVISNANINMILDNNILEIKDSVLYINNSPISVNGSIDEKSIADITIKADKIPLNMVFHSFAPRKVRNSYNFRSGDATFNLGINGKLKDAVTTLKFGMNNFNFSDRAGNFVITDKILESEFFANSKDIRGIIKNDGMGISLPKTRSLISIPQFETEVADNNITVKENKIFFNDNSAITYSGEIVNYLNPKRINFSALGNVSTTDIVKIIGTELKSYIHSSGQIPVKLTFDGNSKKQTLFFQALSDKENFITPVDFSELTDKNISLQSVIDFKGNRIKIKKTGFFNRTVTTDEKGNEVISLDEILGIDGTIAWNRINLIKITMPNALNGKLFIFPKSNFTVNGKAFVFGELSNPRFRGGFSIKNLSIPELLTDVRNLDLRFKGHEFDINIEDLLLNGSDMQVKTTFSMLPSTVLNITNLDVISRYLNVDKLMVVVERAMNYVPGTNTTGAKASANSQKSADIPVDIKNGLINFARIITGNIDLKNTTSRLSLHNNVMYLDNLRTKAFEGDIKGNISVNLLSMLLNIKVNGENVDVEKAMLDAAGMKNTLSGNADFDTDISLQGTSLEEQMKSLKGNVNFVVKDGQFGPFGKLENMILAENIRESAFFQTFIGNMLSGLLSVDTTHFTELKGALNFEDGICYIEPITSSGDILALHLFGNFDLLQNKIDMKVRARMASLISNLLGPISAINPVNLVNSAASMNVVTAKAFSLFCETVPTEEIENLPNFANSYVDNSATKFQIVVRGDVAKPFTLVKSFKWLTTQMEFAKAKEFADSLPVPEEGSTATNIEEAIAEHEANEAKKKTLGYKTKEFGKKIIHPFGGKK